ncbi:MAG: hypothetical protein MMC33_009583 [Icmadophila ericetorum]|nr:hypothetical protein [Icmadophila ericetorum]
MSTDIGSAGAKPNIGQRGEYPEGDSQFKSHTINEKNAAKRARQDEMIPQTAGSPPKRRKTRPPLSEISSNAQIFNLHKPVHTWNRKAEEDKEQAAARRLKDARAKKLRARQRAVRRGETPPPLTPSQPQPFTPPGRHPPVPAPPPARGIMRPVPNANHFTCSVCAAERHIYVLINRGIDDDAVCLYCFHLLADGDAVVPIVPIMCEWEVNHQKLQRTAFPVVLAYAITAHKSQGLTLDRVVLDLTLKDFAMGLTYVAISSGRSLNGIMFDHPFTKARFKQLLSSTRQMRIDDKMRCAEQIL